MAVAEKFAVIVRDVPTCAGVTVTEHCDWPEVVVEASVQVPVMASVASDEVTATVPVGCEEVPEVEESVTVTVAVLPWLISTEVGLSATLLVVGRSWTVKALVAEAPAQVESPAKLTPTPLAYDPALIPARLALLSVAMPLLSVFALPTPLPFRVKEICLLATEHWLKVELKVAVRFTVPLTTPVALDTDKLSGAGVGVGVGVGVGLETVNVVVFVGPL